MKKLCKHVIIAGAPRAGKTMLCLELIKYGFMHYKMDSVKRGICKAFDIDQHDWGFLTNKIAKIINTIIHENFTDTVNGLEYYVIDTCHVLPEDVKFINEDVLIIYLGYENITADEKLKQIRKHDKKHYWSSYVDDEEMLKMMAENIKLSRFIHNECKKYGLKYFDTSYNRNKVLKRVLKLIEKECMKEED